MFSDEKGAGGALGCDCRALLSLVLRTHFVIWFLVSTHWDRRQQGMVRTLHTVQECSVVSSSVSSELGLVSAKLCAGLLDWFL